MAEKRMFTKKIVDSDDFLDLPPSAQALYFHLNMAADDDGFVNNPRKIQRGCDASAEDFDVLVKERFVLCFDGLAVIKHWRMHNTIRKDRYKPTPYTEQMALLDIKEDGAYTEKDLDNQTATTWQPSGNHMATQYSIDKNSIDKSSVDKCSIGEDSEPQNTTPDPFPFFYGKYNNVLLSDDELETLKKDFPDDYDKRIDKLSAYMHSTGKCYKNHAATIQLWAEQDKEKPNNEKQTTSGQSGSNPFLTMARDKGLI